MRAYERQAGGEGAARSRESSRPWESQPSLGFSAGVTMRVAL
jgi:hypothetical protein